MHLYYELNKISIVATPHNIKLILHVPLKSHEQRFTLYKIIILPERVSSGKFIQYLVDYTYFGLNDNQRDYIFLTEAQYNYCKKGSLVMSPAYTAVYHSQTLNCKASLFFQNKRQLSSMPEKATSSISDTDLTTTWCTVGLLFPERQQVTVRCPNSGNQPSRTLSLQGTGLVHNLLTCYISSTTLRTLTELIGSLHAKLETPKLYLPNNVSAISDYETRQLKNILPADTARIDYITSQLATRKQTFNVDSLFHVHEISQQHEQRTR